MHRSLTSKYGSNGKTRSFRLLSSGLEALESRKLMAVDVLLSDSFEGSGSSNNWNDVWVEDAQNDWFRSSQRASDGSKSAEVDGRANNATLTQKSALDVSGYDTSELTFDWLIEKSFDSGEYLALDVSSDGGSTWQTDVRRLNGNSDAEDVWHSESVDLTPYASTSLLIRFRAKVSGRREDANVDNVQITGTSSPTLSVSDAVAYEDGSGWNFAESLESSPASGEFRTWDIAQGENGDLYATTNLDSGGSSILRIDGQTGEVDSSFVPLGTAGLHKAREIVARDGWLYVANKTTNSVLRFDAETGAVDPLGPFIASGENGLVTPRGLTFDATGNLWVISKGTDSIHRYDSQGNYLGLFASDLTTSVTPNDMTFDSAGNLYVSGDGKVLKFANDGSPLGVFADGGSAITTSIEFGPDGDLYVGDGNGAILRFDGQTGAYVDLIANDANGLKQGMLFDEAGSLWVANSSSPGQQARVLRYASSSAAVFKVTLSAASESSVSVTIQTFAGSATANIDYIHTATLLHFGEGVIERAFVVPSLSDFEDESLETFFAQLSNADGATLDDAIGLGEILDNDA